jgi:hypothetical protein
MLNYNNKIKQLKKTKKLKLTSINAPVIKFKFWVIIYYTQNKRAVIKHAFFKKK